MDARTRYCQRCSSLQKLVELDAPRPCRTCGGTNFDAQPPLHSKHKFELTQEDRIFLRVQGIIPED